MLHQCGNQDLCVLGFIKTMFMKLWNVIERNWMRKNILDFLSAFMIAGTVLSIIVFYNLMTHGEFLVLFMIGGMISAALYQLLGGS